MPKPIGQRGGPPLIFPNHTVSASEAGKYLGVMIDGQLNWTAHINYLESKTTKKLSILSAMAGSTWGVKIKDLRRTYIATVLLQFLYCASVWFVPSGGFGYKSKELKTLQIMRKIQSRAGKIISGAFKTTAGAALDVELYLRPIDLQLDIFLNNALLRLTSSPSCKHITSFCSQNLASQDPKQYRLYFAKLSPLKKLEIRFTAIYKKELANMELRNLFPTRLWYNAPQTLIATSAKKAIESHDCLINNPDNIAIYTDGSGIIGRIGAAAVKTITLYPGAQPMVASTKSTYLGLESDFTVCAGELQGINLALNILNKDNSDYSTIIFTDSQAAIQAIENPRNQSGQYILLNLISKLDQLNNRVQIHWIPAHVGVFGNKTADKAAKEATGWRENAPPTTPQSNFADNCILISAAKTDIRRRANQQWTEAWAYNTTGRKTFKLTREPTAKVLVKYVNMTQKQSSVIIQARTGKIGLRSYLYTINAKPSRECLCGEGPQTVEHVLLCCPEFNDLRGEMWEGKRETNLTRLLGDPAIAKRAANFLLATGKLYQFKHAKEPSSKDET